MYKLLPDCCDSLLLFSGRATFGLRRHRRLLSLDGLKDGQDLLGDQAPDHLNLSEAQIVHACVRYPPSKLA